MAQPTDIEMEGVKTATRYMWRQHWRMKWMTLLVSGPMAAYSVNAHEWIPFIGFNMISWTLLLIAQVLSQISLNKLFIIYTRHKHEGKEPDAEIMREINHHAWIHWAIALMFWYWIVVLVLASDLYNLS